MTIGSRPLAADPDRRVGIRRRSCWRSAPPREAPDWGLRRFHSICPPPRRACRRHWLSQRRAVCDHIDTRRHCDANRVSMKSYPGQLCSERLPSAMIASWRGCRFREREKGHVCHILAGKAAAASAPLRPAPPPLPRVWTGIRIVIAGFRAVDIAVRSVRPVRIAGTDRLPLAGPGASP
jgi:hypothetical protein